MRELAMRRLEDCQQAGLYADSPTQPQLQAYCSYYSQGTFRVRYRMRRQQGWRGRVSMEDS